MISRFFIPDEETPYENATATIDHTAEAASATTAAAARAPTAVAAAAVSAPSLSLRRGAAASPAGLFRGGGGNLRTGIPRAVHVLPQLGHKEEDSHSECSSDAPKIRAF